jgi:Tfp pilus assembly protein PilF
MNESSFKHPRFVFRGLFFFFAALVVWLGLLPLRVSSQTNTGSNASSTNNLLVMIQGSVEVAKAGTDKWVTGKLNQPLSPADRVRTGERSRAEIFLANGMTIQKGEFSEIEIPPSPGVTFRKGLFNVLNRERGRNSEFKLPGATAAVRGTDFLVRVDGERAELTVLDGEVLLSNAAGEVSLTNMERGVVENGGAPRKTAVVEAVNDLIQWSLYYPGVLNPDELDFSSDEKNSLANSLNAYRSGDLLQAVAEFPWQTQPSSDSDRAYRAALLLSVGQVEKAQGLLKTIPGTSSSAQALGELIAAIKFEIWNRTSPPGSAAEWLAESYYLQSRYKLDEALNAARAATTNSPNFGFAWARLAELEFSFGHSTGAADALEKSLQLSPRNAQAISLKGFLLAARNKIPAAISQFDQAIAIDSALGNAWLGRGLCFIHQGRADDGLRELHVAASLEPQRSVLRSYLGKAFANAGDERHAEKELSLAKQFDPNDPTSWLYSALLNQERYRINDAVSDLERSQELNDNRRLFRSRLLLDQDRAVRGANLAAIYRDAGMFDVSVREASRAVASDYANYSSHLFLANSYSELTDPNLVSLRYETATFSEYLVANLLAPVGATTLSQQVSQQEYSSLFEHDHLGVSSSTTYLSRGDWQQEGSQYGTMGNSAYALDGIYRSFNGERRNNDLEQYVLSAQFKQQLTPQDSVYLQVIYNDFTSGDLRQYYDPQFSSAALRVTELQQPNLFVGYHHEWSPGVHTLFLAGRLNDTLTLREPSAIVTTIYRDNIGTPVTAISDPPDIFDLRYKNQLNAYSAELQQIWQIPNHTLIAGARFQTSEIETRDRLDYLGPRVTDPPVINPLTTQKNTADLVRANVYAYYNWQIVDPLSLSAGVSFDHLDYPQNVDSPPISSKQASKDQVSPKAGFIWTPCDSTSVRGVYTRSLGGLFYDQSVRLEPTQVAGFNQAFRSLFPDSLVGPVPGSEFETFQLGLDHKFKTRTYVVLDAAILKSKAERTMGVFEFFEFNNSPPAAASQTRQKLDFEEKSLTLTLNQLVGDRWSLGSRYRLSQSELDTKLPDVPTTVITNTHDRAVLHQLNLFTIYNHPSGFFAEAEALWWAQSNHGYIPDLSGDDFWQFNVFAGYRFPRRHGEITVGLANITDQNYRLNPLSLYGELPRDRTLVVSFKFNF